MGKVSNYYPQPDWKGGLEILVGLILGMIICAVMGSCKTRQGVIKERVVYDTVWSVKTVHDSINGVRVEKEITRIVPHVIRVGDTTIVYSDTTIIRNVEGSNYVYKNYYQDKGQISKDSARIEEKKLLPAQKEKDKGKDFKWRVFWTGIIIGLLVALVFRFRKKIFSLLKGFIRRF